MAALSGLLARGCLAAALVACVAPTRTAAAPVEQGTPLEIETSIPATAGFGEPITARVVVRARRNVVDADRLRVTSALAPLTQLTATEVSRTSEGDTEIATYGVTAACLDQRCVAPSGVRRLRLPAVRAEAPGRNGSLVSVTRPWPALAVRGRVRASDLTRSPLPFRADLDAPTVSYRIAPATLTLLLLAAALVLALGAIVLAWRHVARLVRRRGFVEPSELERALAFARSSEARSPEDRRRALGLLARVLRAREQRLAPATSTLAWSAPLPTPRSISSLLEEVEHEVDEP
jgi:hypothetical protein